LDQIKADMLQFERQLTVVCPIVLPTIIWRDSTRRNP
jgi:hypothetical protein